MKFELNVVVVILCYVKIGLCASITPLEYLEKYGYIEKGVMNSNQLISKNVLSNAIGEFQKKFNIEVTGTMNTETQKMMQRPRCGIKDNYQLESRWEIPNLIYKIETYPSRVYSREYVDSEIQRAFNAWSQYTDLTFTPTQGSAHIIIRFERGYHNDAQPFDGSGGTLAHAYYPSDGRIHFDDDEAWQIRGDIDIFQVAVHEIGHALGLDHSSDQQAIMFPAYTGYSPSFSLGREDIQRIQRLYGGKTSPREEPKFGNDQPKEPTYGRPSYGDGGVYHSPGYHNRHWWYYNRPSYWYGTRGWSNGWPYGSRLESSSQNSLCADPKFDTIFESSTGNVYVFKGDRYWKLEKQGIADGYPKLISEMWHGLPNNIDAAFTYNKYNRTYFFKGSKYWRYNGNKLEEGFPKYISQYFPGIPNSVDAALSINDTEKIYFFKDSKFWVFDNRQTPSVSGPGPISQFNGVPDKLDGSVRLSNSHIGFFKNEKVYMYNIGTSSVEGNVRYAVELLQCKRQQYQYASEMKGDDPSQNSTSSSNILNMPFNLATLSLILIAKFI